MKPKFNRRTAVLQYYPNATPVNVGCKNGDYYNIKDGIFVMGKGKTKRESWRAAYKSMNED